MAVIMRRPAGLSAEQLDLSRGRRFMYSLADPSQVQVSAKPTWWKARRAAR